MEKQETEMKRKLEMETGNGNWKQKCKQKAYHSLVQYFLCNVLSHYWLYESCFAFSPVLCFVITAFSVIEVLMSQAVLQCSLVHI